MTCAHCTNADNSMIEFIGLTEFFLVYLCNVCGKTFGIRKAVNSGSSQVESRESARNH